MYKLNKTQEITRLSDSACIPPDPDNRDYSEYTRWLAAGNTPAPAELQAWTVVKAAMLVSAQAAQERLLTRLSEAAGRRARAGDLTTAAACDAACVKLLALSAFPAVVAAGTEAALQTAIADALVDAKSGLPVGLKTALTQLGL